MTSHFGIFVCTVTVKTDPSSGPERRLPVKTGTIPRHTFSEVRENPRWM